jgi:asparagine synthase (glutamine-hydrolysing)
MSVQFGRWNFEGQPPAPDYIEKVSATLAPYGPDSNESYSNDGIRILYRAFHTTKESRREKQPCVAPSGNVITWDGRLDNRADLISQLGLSVIPSTAWDPLSSSPTDVAIVAAAYEKWGANCLRKLIGDWALSIWNSREHFVLLARDPIGTKRLYYSFDEKQLIWSTILDPLVLFAGKTFEICEEYVAGWFAVMFPTADLTPYVGIHAVPPASSVLLRPDKHAHGPHGEHGVKHIVTKYWDFDRGKRIRYKTDAEYEEQFRSALAQAVQRRLRSDHPVLAELSGGMDSSSIVCVADLIMGVGVNRSLASRHLSLVTSRVDCPRLDTITWYDESKPNWGEIPQFTKVEENRGHIGHHVNAGALREHSSSIPFGAEFSSDRFAATPTPDSRRSELFQQSAAYIRSQGYRVILSGIGGSEVTGDGVPTPTPELQDLLAGAHFVTLFRQLNAWAAKMRTPRLPLLWEAIRGFFFGPEEMAKEMRLASWLHSGFVRRNRAALCDYPSRVKLFGASPSFQHNFRTLVSEQKLLEMYAPQRELLREIRFPFLDRDFLEFMYAIPREQVVRMGQRRSLMKRALVGVVPDEILSRKKKDVVRHAPPKDNSAEWPSLVEVGRRVVTSSQGIIDPDRFAETLQKARRNEEVPSDILRRTLILESWLRHLTTQKVLGSTE